MASIDKLYQDETCLVAAHRQLFLAAWYDAPTLGQVREYARHARALHARFRGNTLAANLIVRGKPRFDDDVRAEIVRLMRDDGISSRASAHVVLVEGLGGTAVRAFLSTVILVARPTRPEKVFATAPSAARWLSAEVADDPTHPGEAELLEACEAALAEGPRA